MWKSVKAESKKKFTQGKPVTTKYFLKKLKKMKETPNRRLKEIYDIKPSKFEQVIVFISLKTLKKHVNT